MLIAPTKPPFGSSASSARLQFEDLGADAAWGAQRFVGLEIAIRAVHASYWGGPRIWVTRGVLIAEDDLLIAKHMADVIEASGGPPLEPVAECADAYILAQAIPVDLALVSLQLRGRRPLGRLGASRDEPCTGHRPVRLRQHITAAAAAQITVPAKALHRPDLLDPAAAAMTLNMR
jgi:hypothetical protein